jgi:hypothetical protein
VWGWGESRANIEEMMLYVQIVLCPEESNMTEFSGKAGRLIFVSISGNKFSQPRRKESENTGKKN